MVSAESTAVLLVTPESFICVAEEDARILREYYPEVRLIKANGKHMSIWLDRLRVFRAVESAGGDVRLISYGGVGEKIGNIGNRWTERGSSGPMAYAGGGVQIPFHRVDEHALTFISFGYSERWNSFVEAMIKARPMSKIRWIIAGDTFAPQQSYISTIFGISELEPKEKVDFALVCDMDLFHAERAVAECCARAIPLLSSVMKGDEYLIDDSCGVPLPKDFTNEELIRGILPFINSDARMASLREGAHARWEESYEYSRYRQNLLYEVR